MDEKHSQCRKLDDELAEKILDSEKLIFLHVQTKAALTTYLNMDSDENPEAKEGLRKYMETDLLFQRSVAELDEIIEYVEFEPHTRHMNLIDVPKKELEDFAMYVESYHIPSTWFTMHMDHPNKVNNNKIAGSCSLNTLRTIAWWIDVDQELIEAEFSDLFFLRNTSFACQADLLSDKLVFTSENDWDTHTLEINISSWNNQKIIQLIKYLGPKNWTLDELLGISVRRTSGSE